MASSSNQAQNFDYTVDIESSSGNILNNQNNVFIEGVCDSTATSVIENFVDVFDDSFSRTTNLWKPKVSDPNLKPYSGQWFKDIESCFQFYTQYGLQGGFNVHPYVVSCFIEVHNHPLASESGKEFLRANRSMTELQRHFLLDASKSNLGAYRAHGIYKSCFGLYSDVGPTAVDFQNWMRDIKLYIGKHDADMLLQKFRDKNETSDGGFCYEYQTDSDGHLNRLFWADVRGRKNYDVFSDVACEMFLKVFCRPPKCIITDQCLAMKVAIQKTFPDSIHRYCMWHIMQKFPAKIGPVFCAESGFMEKLNKFVWSSHLTVAEFKEGWNAMLNEFGLSNHVWLNEIYGMRKSWIPAFFRDKPMGALLRTTSRSESSNFYFNHFVQKGDTLSEFYMCYESAIDKQIHENKKLTNGDTCVPQSITEKEIEKHAAHLYTRTMFYKVQKHIKVSCFHMILANQPIVVDGVNKYVVRDRSLNDKLFEVEFCFSKNDVCCSCKFFVRVGYLCRHCFYILGLWGVERIPNQFLSRRWLRNAEERFCTLKFPDDLQSSNDHIVKDTSKKILTEFQNCYGKVSNHIEGLNFMLEEMKCLNIRIEQKFHKSAVTKDDMLEEHFGVRPSGASSVLPPLQSNNKGSRKRILGPAEISCD
ncbi:hypothetical protein POM88_048906 [Heracleum sosnowskyi]|uniref:SWIM-type domain-containing protein n=1 Tax=Heracleum sosnowskyi TaxID=360622 RepID=A0AAD8LZ00_9APIA|nr:hypothetical protein POM88_048906 [Heracleum sosnowskyi]